MSHKSQVTRQTSVVVNYNAIRNQDVLNKWKELRQEYVLYTDKVMLLSLPIGHSTDSRTCFTRYNLFKTPIQTSK